MVILKVKMEKVEVKKMLKEMREMKELMIEMKEMKGSMTEMKVLMMEVKEMKRSVEFMNSKFEECMANLDKGKKENDLLKTKVKGLEDELNRMTNGQQNVEENLMLLKNEQLQNNLEFVGIPCENQENCIELAFGVASKVCTTLKREDIETAHRVGSPKDRQGQMKASRPLLVKFKERNVRHYVFQNKRKMRPSENITMLPTSKSGSLPTRPRIFINESLCKESKDLMRKTNQKRKEKGYKFIWTSFGRILIRKSEGDDAICIKSTKDLDLI